MKYNDLNDKQKEITDNILNKLDSVIYSETKEYSDCFVELRGKSGSGKSTTTSVLLQEILKRRKNNIPLRVKMVTPTHKSLAVIQDMIDVVKDNSDNPSLIDSFLSCSTIHSYLKLKVKQDYNSGKEYISKDTNKDVDKVDVLVIDEMSMVSEDLFNYILEEFHENKYFFVIFVGDLAQLFPINSECIPFVEDDSLSTRYELTEIVRQAKGNPIVELGESVRQHIEDNMYNQVSYPNYNVVLDYMKKFEQSPFIEIVSSKTKFKENYQQSEYRQDDKLITCFKNVTVKSYNKFARNFHIGKDSESYTKGEKLVFNEVHVEDDEIIHNNNEIIEIHDLKKLRDTYYEIDYWSIMDSKGKQANIIDPKSLPDWEYEIQEIVNKAKKATGKERSELWKEYFEMKQTYPSVYYPFSCTITKSQGSSVKEVYIDVEELIEASRRGNLDLIYRLTYVAITRAKERVILYIKN